MISKIRFFLLLLTLAGAGATVSVGSEDGVTRVAADDAAMNTAIATARSKLPHFWATFADPKNGESDFCLKVRIEDKNGVEHFWCVDVRRAGGKITAELNNDPNIVQSVAVGDRITIAEDQISDWLYMKQGKMIGNYTLRPLFDSMSAEERKQLEAMLGELP